MDGQTDRQTNGRWMDRLTEGQWLPVRMPSTLTSGTDFERRHTDGKRSVVGTLLEHRHSDVPIRFVQDWSALIQRHPNSCKTSCRLYVSQPHTDNGHRQQCILLTETHCSMGCLLSPYRVYNILLTETHCSMGCLLSPYRVYNIPLLCTQSCASAIV